MVIDTLRLRLRPWCPEDEDAFASLHADPDVMRDQGGPVGRAESREKLDRYAACHRRFGFSRWAIEDRGGGFLGYAGAMPSPDDHPTAPAWQIGWRLIRAAWGRGYATEAAGASLRDIFDRGHDGDILAFTASDNFRSRAVMARLGLQRDPSRDFTTLDPRLGAWRGLVWVAEPDAFRTIPNRSADVPCRAGEGRS